MMSKQDGLRESVRNPSHLHTVYAAVLRSIFSLDKFNTVFIASDGVTNDASFVTLGLAREAAQYGYRVLLIECPRDTSLMADVINYDAVPVLVQIGGSVVVAVPDGSGENLVYVAPSFKDPLSALSTMSECLQIDYVCDIAKRFDLVLIEGDTANTAAARSWLKLATKTMLVSAGGIASSTISGVNIEDPRVFLGTIVSRAVHEAARVARSPSSVSRKIRVPNRAMSRLFDMKMRVSGDSLLAAC